MRMKKNITANSSSNKIERLKIVIGSVVKKFFNFVKRIIVKAIAAPLLSGTVIV